MFAPIKALFARSASKSFVPNPHSFILITSGLWKKGIGGGWPDDDGGDDDGDDHLRTVRRKGVGSGRKFSPRLAREGGGGGEGGAGRTWTKLLSSKSPSQGSP